MKKLGQKQMLSAECQAKVDALTIDAQAMRDRLSRGEAFPDSMSTMDALNARQNEMNAMAIPEKKWAIDLLKDAKPASQWVN